MCKSGVEQRRRSGEVEIRCSGEKGESAVCCCECLGLVAGSLSLSAGRFGLVAGCTCFFLLRVEEKWAKVKKCFAPKVRPFPRRFLLPLLWRPPSNKEAMTSPQASRGDLIVLLPSQSGRQIQSGQLSGELAGAQVFWRADFFERRRQWWAKRQEKSGGKGPNVGLWCLLAEHLSQSLNEWKFLRHFLGTIFAAKKWQQGALLASPKTQVSPRQSPQDSLRKTVARRHKMAGRR